jgi:hypothetical protein
MVSNKVWFLDFPLSLIKIQTLIFSALVLHVWL